jgi:hypothetical protein
MQKVAQLVLNFDARDTLSFAITEYPLEKLVEPLCCSHTTAPFLAHRVIRCAAICSVVIGCIADARIVPLPRRSRSCWSGLAAPPIDGIPPRCLSVVLWHTLAVVVHNPEIVLGLGVTLVRSLAIPLQSLSVVLRYALSDRDVQP